MKIGIIGAGNIGHTAARLFVKADHEVAISNSRGPESLRDVVSELGEKAHAATVDEAAAFGEVILLAVPWSKPEALPNAQTVAGKIVIDAMNPYKPGGGLYDLDDSTSSEETAKRLPGARIVKAFNTIWYKHLAEQGDVSKPEGQRRAIFVAGDDADAKAIVSDLIRTIGFAPVDTGSLHEGGRKQQPDTDIYNKSLTGAEAREALASV
ncbi:Metalloreductase STEAP4 [Fibrisoma limi BUZ 3]|uniref:Metalloreductase STEAP4 n=1 Tax=Fibrisoma limi BUZ 3 TaxID=1185876 RepID=I2GTQ9_9BACT|nr:NAD(P)-binding domain-containing protein [Fibrisoma limi]CCH57289.1 Metalloreductase STEAP4 [Fibrisoma limi BUZ 3]